MSDMIFKGNGPPLEDQYYEGSPCMVCIHLITAGDQRGFGWKCKAYPVEIPESIVNWQDSHAENRPFDRGFKFESEEMEYEDGSIWVYTWDHGIVKKEQ